MAEPSSSKPSPPLSPMRIPESPLSTAELLTRQEVLRRRSSRVRQLAKCYRSHYWALMEELKAKHKEYYWMYGKSPYKEEEEQEQEREEEDEEQQQQQQHRNRRGEGTGGNEGVEMGEDVGGEEMTTTMMMRRCEVTGCKGKAMALTRYCHTHILSDSKQSLYKSCTYCIKSTQTGPLLCCKPVLRSTVPLLCPTHMPVAEKHLIRVLKRAGLNISSTKKLAPKFHVVVAEYVRQIQTKRRAARKATIAKDRIDEEMR